MRRGWILVIIILLIIILGITTWLILKNQEDIISTSCTELGCQSNAVYVGSVNSDKYYECDCHYADRINPENIICFTSDSDAQNKGYVKSDC